jgi:potassium-transporting ATPase potassium-binding subunit
MHAIASDLAHDARFFVIVTVPAIAGSLAVKRSVPRSAAALPTDELQFDLLLARTIVIVGGPSFFSALSPGPLAEHFALQAGFTY